MTSNRTHVSETFHVLIGVSVWTSILAAFVVLGSFLYSKVKAEAGALGLSPTIQRDDREGIATIQRDDREGIAIATTVPQSLRCVPFILGAVGVSRPLPSSSLSLSLPPLPLIVPSLHSLLVAPLSSLISHRLSGGTPRDSSSGGRSGTSSSSSRSS